MCMKRWIVISVSVLSLLSCSMKPDKWSRDEMALITEECQVMRVLTEDVPEDSLFLRESSTSLAPELIAGDTYRMLAAKMLATVTSPEQDGVGIAAPQVGIHRRVVAVMRYDREGTPFEVYPNIRITEYHGALEEGPEGCLSVPGMRGVVPRYQEIEICYTSPLTLADTSELVSGYTAVIFQHECDHLDGILYTDKAVSITEL